MNSQDYLLREWEKIKNVVDEVTEPFFDKYCADNVDKSVSRMVVHDANGKMSKTHSCTNFQLRFAEGPKWQIEFYWVVCNKCKPSTRRKYVVGWNAEDGLAYENELLKPEVS